MHRLLTVLLLVTSLAACDRSGSITFAPEAEVQSTFSSGLEGWLPGATGLATGSNVDLIAEGGMAHLVVDAAGPGGRAWMEREAILTPGITYDVEVEFALGTSDGDDVTPWTVVAGTSVDGGAFVFADLGTTAGGGGASEVTLLLDGSLRFTTPASGSGDEESDVRIALGVGPTTAGTRSYGLDDVTVRFVRVN